MRPCTACKHPQRPLIDDAILRKEPAIRIGERVNPSLTQWVILRHAKHLERGIVVERVEVDPNRSLIDRIEDVIHRVDGVAVAAQSAKNWAAATGALRELRCCLELLAKISGQLQTGGRPISVAVGVHVDTRGQQAGSLNEFELDQRIAQEVFEATDGFRPETIARLRQLVESATGGLPDVPQQLTENTRR